MTEPMSAERLAEIRARAERLKVRKIGAAWVAEAVKSGADDVPDLLAEIDRLTLERDLALAHDTQPYPTAWAYEQACKTIDRLRAIKTRPVHNHGTEEGPGLHCREHVLTDGSLLGACMLAPLPPQSRTSRWFSENREQREAEALARAMDRIVGES